MKMKRILSGAVALLVLATAAGCAGNGDADTSNNADGGKTEKFTWWIGQGSDTSFYSTYEENPTVRYLTSMSWGTDKTKIELKFQVPVAGAERDNFNTLLATGEYSDIMDLTYYSGSVADLYEEGTILDLTEYIDKYMPNYKAFMDSHPDIKRTATNLVNGEKKFLRLWGYRDEPTDNWGGYLYRRDWIVKYGKNPADGSAFSGAYTVKNDDGTWDNESWADDVIFPSGGADPIYISDWEWMFEIFTRAIEDLGIKDGYCTSLSYPGYIETGDLVCAFGGVGGGWNKDPNDKIVFGPTSDSFRVYLQAMSEWYKKGWIDKAFTEHSNDLFYKIDDTKVRQGKVGLWYGLLAQLGGKMDNHVGYTDGIVAFGAAQPINDIYGSSAQQNQTPYTMYQQGLEANEIAISGKVKDKDAEALFSMLDWLYSEEGGLLRMFGLNKEQFEAIQDPFYIKYGLTEGAYYPIEEDGITKYRASDVIRYDRGNLSNAAIGIRLFGLDPVTIEAAKYSPTMEAQVDQWTKYINTGRLERAFTGQLTPEEASAFAKVETNIREFLSKNVPNFIKGAKDPFSDADWAQYLKAVEKYGPDKNTALYQNLLDTLK